MNSNKQMNEVAKAHLDLRGGRRPRLAHRICSMHYGKWIGDELQGVTVTSDEQSLKDIVSLWPEAHKRLTEERFGEGRMVYISF